jgi:hypothetical protein
MLVATIVAPENHEEQFDDGMTISILGSQYRANELWGQRAMVRRICCENFGNEKLFEDTMA